MEKTLSNFAKVSLVLAASTFCLAARAGDHVADDKIAVAKAALQHAEQAGGPEAAPVQMATACRAVRVVWVPSLLVTTT